MKRFIAFLLVFLLIPIASMAADLTAMTTEELTQLRLEIDREIASRAGSAEAQSVTVDGVVFRLLLVEVGQARDDRQGLGVILLADNTGEASMTPLYDLGVTVTHGGIPLETSWVISEHFTSSSVSVSQSAVIRPGAAGMQVFLGFVLAGEGGEVEITLSARHTRSNEDPYRGTLFAQIPAL